MPARTTLTDKDRRFIAEQHIFFVATAPGKLDGLVNLSPKGIAGTFAVIDDSTIAYLDLTGSGIETVAHLKDNGRICVMFCAFAGSPNILRIHGTGEVIEPAHADFAALMQTHFPTHADSPAVRSIIRVTPKRIADSCGFGVPLYEYQGERTKLLDWANDNGREAITAYQAKHNRASLDGLAGLGI